jgi:hypothetical protein
MSSGSLKKSLRTFHIPVEGVQKCRKAAKNAGFCKALSLRAWTGELPDAQHRFGVEVLEGEIDEMGFLAHGPLAHRRDHPDN